MHTYMYIYIYIYIYIHQTHGADADPAGRLRPERGVATLLSQYVECMAMEMPNDKAVTVAIAIGLSFIETSAIMRTPCRQPPNRARAFRAVGSVRENRNHAVRNHVGRFTRTGCPGMLVQTHGVHH